VHNERRLLLALLFLCADWLDEPDAAFPLIQAELGFAAELETGFAHGMVGE
jgi:hypothetical protein